MRDIKFRVWDEINKCFIHQFYIGNDGYVYNWSAEILINCQLMQFTGLHDKNGREIYEGDLIQLMDNKTGFMTVEFINAYVGGWVLTFKDSDPLSLGARQADQLLIVGNIHENTELLESAK